MFTLFALVAVILGAWATVNRSTDRGVSIADRFALLAGRGQAGDLRLAPASALESLSTEISAKVAQARDIAKGVEDQNRDLTGEERASIKSLLDEAKTAKARHDQLTGDAEVERELTILGTVAGDLAKAGGAQLKAGGSFGQRFVDSDVYSNLLKSHGATDGRAISEKSRVQSDPVDFRFKDLVTGAADASGGALVNTDHLGLLDVGAYQRPLNVRSLITNGTTGSDTVDYAREVSVTNAAATVAEATKAGAIGSGTPAITNTTGGVKPESAFVLEKITDTVKTVAHWIPATKRALSDAAQIRTLLDGFLLYGLDEELEDQIVTGNASGENFDGLTHVSGTTPQAWDTDRLVTARKAKTKVRTVGRAIANGYLLNPADWEAIDLMRDGNERFYGAGPFAVTTPTLWGLPVVESEAIPEGTGICADFRKAILWDREQGSVVVSDSHADFFVRNLVALLAELRAAFGVIRPAAFVVMDLTA